MCWTGARHSDLEQLNYNSIHVTEDGERYIQYKAKKTDKISVVKILPETQAILDLYDDGREMPRVISNQKFNDALKEIMKAVYEANPESTLAGYVTKAYTADVGNGRGWSQNRHIPAMADGELPHRAPLIRHQYATTR